MINTSFYVNFPSFIEYTQYTLVKYLGPPKVFYFFEKRSVISLWLYLQQNRAVQIQSIE